MKKHIRVVAILVIFVLSLVSFVACSPKTIKQGDFAYIVKNNNAYLVGITQSGQEKEELILPKYVNGKEVIKMYYYEFIAYSSAARIKSENLKKLFIMGENFKTSELGYQSDNPNLTKVIRIVIDFENRPSYGVGNYYVPYSLNYSYANYIGHGFRIKYANISYMQNYEGSEQNNEGYYWVDHENYGKMISPPPSPSRSEYTFDGWYKEPSCLNKWDFEVDRLPEEIIEEIKNDKGEMIERPIYQNTYLYAKWTKK